MYCKIDKLERPDIPPARPSAMYGDDKYENVVKSMNDYLEWLKSLPKDEAYKVSMRNLIETGIINEDGSISDNYHKLKG